jgi:threonine/homoserine/homoserine lactone efflux protein
MLEFLVASVIVVASPGPGATFTIATTASQGWRSGGSRPSDARSVSPPT